MFYLSTQPSQYAPIAHGIGAAGMGKGSGWRRLVVEKPFGHDLASARELSNELHEVFEESDVYRIDHYLGKETVQNILAFRFGNGIFEPLWNRRYVNHVQITGAESIGVEGPRRLLPGSRRARRYDPESPAPGDGHYRDGA
jgi:glucose-6-phosphate 1-dehydrogenase